MPESKTTRVRLSRAKDLNTEQWIEGFYVHDEEWGRHYIYQKIKKAVYFELVRFEVDGDTVGQFICEYDGVEYWEGDIIEYGSMEFPSRQTLSFEIYDDQQGFCIPLDDTPTIVGNIHDNPELGATGKG